MGIHYPGIVSGIRLADAECTVARNGEKCIPGNSRAWIAGRFPLQYAGQEYLPELRYRSLEYLQYGFRVVG